MSPRQFRLHRNLTLNEMAALLSKHHPDGAGPNYSTVSKHERGDIFPTAENIELWRKATKGKVLYEDFDAIRLARRDAALKASAELPPAPDALVAN